MVLLYFDKEYIDSWRLTSRGSRRGWSCTCGTACAAEKLPSAALARVTGISQPHLHNVLKGKRFLSVGKSDQILQQLHLDLMDLIETTTSR